MPGMWRPKITASTPQRVVIGRTDSMRSGGQCNRPEGPKVALCLRRGLPSAAHEPLLDRSAAALGIEPDQKDIVELADELDNIFLIRRSEEHTSELQSPLNLVSRLLLYKKTKISLAILHDHLQITKP